MKGRGRLEGLVDERRIEEDGKGERKVGGERGRWRGEPLSEPI